MLQGQYYSFSTGSVVAGTDLIEVAETTLNRSNIVARKITLISSGSVALDINNLGTSSTLFQDVDLLYKLSLDGEDCLISSLVITQTTACPIFLAMVF